VIPAVGTMTRRMFRVDQRFDTPFSYLIHATLLWEEFCVSYTALVLQACREKL
jgi:hypothetical protein